MKPIHPAPRPCRFLLACALLLLATLPAACQSAPPAATEPPAAAPSATPPPTPTETPPPSPTPEPPAEAPVTCGGGTFAPLAFLPEGLLGRTEAGLVLWNPADAQQQPFLDAPGITAAALAPDGASLALALEDNSIRLYRTADRALVHTLAGHLGRVTGLAFSPDGARLFSASRDGFVTEWEASTRLQLHSFRPGGETPSEVYALAVSPTGDRLATVAFEGPLRVWDLPEYTLHAEFAAADGAFDGAQAAFSPDGLRVARAPGGGPVEVWDVESGERLWSGGEHAIAFSPDGSLLAFSDRDDAGEPAVALRPAEGAGEARRLGPQGGLIWRIVFSPDAARLAAASDAETRVWRVEDGSAVGVWRSDCP